MPAHIRIYLNVTVQYFQANKCRQFEYGYGCPTSGFGNAGLYNPLRVYNFVEAFVNSVESLHAYSSLQKCMIIFFDKDSSEARTFIHFIALSRDPLYILLATCMAFCYERGSRPVMEFKFSREPVVLIPN